MIRLFFKFLFRLFYWICTIVGFIIVILSLGLYFGKMGPFSFSSKLSDKDSVLSLTLNGTYVEHADSKGIQSLLLGKNASLYHVTSAIFKAAQDDKIKGLVLRIESPSLGVGQIQELREALLAFRQTGKPTWCYADSYGDSSSGTSHYYLATACNEVWVQPMGTINLVGLAIDVPFAKGALEKLGVKPELTPRKEYKSFMEIFMREDFSDANREASQAIADSILSQFVEGIAKERNIPHEQVRLLINNGPYLAEEAYAAKLVDRIDFRHNLISNIQEKLGQHIEVMKIKDYLPHSGEKVHGHKVALIFGSGLIQRDGGDSQINELLISSNPTYRAFQQAIEDKDVKAIVYRINSGGGSPVASETIYGIIDYAKTHAKKPVIVSMSDAAASGGYWIAVAGSKIVAQPATLTGSIGVYGGKFDLSGLFEKLGINVGQVITNENASMWKTNKAFTPAQWIKLNALMDDIYANFTSRVAKGRNMTPQQVEKVARGRVWTGEQALALGLVDQLGGLHVALDLARKEAGLLSTAGVQVYPEQKTFIESLLSLFEKDDDDSLSEMGVLETTMRPFNKILAIYNIFMASQENLYIPPGKIE